MADKGLLDGLTGEKFLQSIVDHENTCAHATSEVLPKLGTKAPQCYEVLGMTLALTDSASSCYWGCAGSDHRLEFLFGRATNSAYAALSLMSRGYYDQALSLARTLGEIANLLALFAANKPKLEEWKGADERTRKREFAPIKVRLAIEELNAPLPVDENRYGRLSTFSIHAIPDALPQAHNRDGQPLTFSSFQEAGLLLTLNEIAMPMAFIALYASVFLTMDDEGREVFRDIARLLLESVGGVDVTVEGRPWFKLS
jgi:hypothetical protein